MKSDQKGTKKRNKHLDGTKKAKHGHINLVRLDKEYRMEEEEILTPAVI